MMPDRRFYGRNDVELVNDETAFHGFFQIRALSLRHRLFAGGWGPLIQRELFVRGDAVGVLLYDPYRDEIALVEQFRVGPYFRQDTRPWIQELVAGIIENTETPAAVARREADEEAGCVVQALEPIGEYYSSPGGCSEYIYLFCGKTDLSQAGGIHGLADEAEDIRVEVVTCEEAFARLAAGHFRNAHTLIALLWLQLHRDELRKRWLGGGQG